MDFISIDTEELKQMALLSVQISDEMTNCKNIVSSVVEHDEWNCMERDSINEQIKSIKSKYSTLSDLFIQFSSGINQLASEFETLDNMIPNDYAKLDVVLGQMNSITNISDSNVNSNLKNISSDVLLDVNVLGGVEKYSLANAFDPIAICNFDILTSQK